MAMSVHWREKGEQMSGVLWFYLALYDFICFYMILHDFPQDCYESSSISGMEAA